jgi:hypothetical protein
MSDKASWSQLRTLSRVVAEAFAVHVTDEQKSGPIVHTDLPWAVPPLRTTVTLSGVPLAEYLDPQLSMDPDQLIAFWHKTLQAMWHTPAASVYRGQYRGLNTLMPKVRHGIRMLLFSVPLGYPAQLEETAGVLFSLEVAHLAALSIPHAHVVDDDSNYYVVLHDGREIGVKAGRPIIHSPWEYDASGMVWYFLDTMRGNASYACQYDQIAKLRSILYENQQTLAPVFEGLDMALQALRVMSVGGRCPDLLSATARSVGKIDVLREKERILWGAIDIMRAPMVDQRRLQALYALLVPEYFGRSAFRKYIFSTAVFPYTLPAGRAEAIEQELITRYESEIPCNLRRKLP